MDLNDIGGFLKLAASLIPALWGRTLIVLGIASMFQNAYGGTRIKGEGGAPGRPTVGQYASFWSAVVAAGAAFGCVLLIIVCLYYGMYSQVSSTAGDAFGKLGLALLLWLPLCIWGWHLVRLNLEALTRPVALLRHTEAGLQQRRGLLTISLTLAVFALFFWLAFGLTAGAVMTYLFMLYHLVVFLRRGGAPIVGRDSRHSIPVVVVLCLLVLAAVPFLGAFFGFMDEFSTPSFTSGLTVGTYLSSVMLVLFFLISAGVVLAGNDRRGRRLLGWLLFVVELGCLATAATLLPVQGSNWATYGRFIGAASFVAPIIALSVWLHDLPRSTGSQREVEGAASPGLF